MYISILTKAKFQSLENILLKKYLGCISLFDDKIRLCSFKHIIYFLRLPLRSNRACVVPERAPHCSLTSRLVRENFMFNLYGCETCATLDP